MSCTKNYDDSLEPLSSQDYQRLFNKDEDWQISGQQRVLTKRWKNLQIAKMVNASLNAFGLYSYDNILMIAHSLNA